VLHGFCVILIGRADEPQEAQVARARKVLE